MFGRTISNEFKVGNQMFHYSFFGVSMPKKEIIKSEINDRAINRFRMKLGVNIKSNKNLFDLNECDVHSFRRFSRGKWIVSKWFNVKETNSEYLWSEHIFASFASRKHGNKQTEKQTLINTKSIIKCRNAPS